MLLTLDSSHSRCQNLLTHVAATEYSEVVTDMPNSNRKMQKQRAVHPTADSSQAVQALSGHLRHCQTEAQCAEQAKRSTKGPSTEMLAYYFLTEGYSHFKGLPSQIAMSHVT